MPLAPFGLLMPWLQSLPTERRPNPIPKTEAQLLVTQDVVHVVVVSQRVAEASVSEKRRRWDLIFLFAPDLWVDIG